MSVICKFPQGGGQNNAPLGLDIYSQIDEPKDKYGIWVKTNTKCKNILCNQEIFEDDGTWSELYPLPQEAYQGDRGCIATQYHGKLYVITKPAPTYSEVNLYSYNGNSWTFEMMLIDNNVNKSITGKVVYNGKFYMVIANEVHDKWIKYLYLYNNDNTLTNLGKLTNTSTILFAYNGNLYYGKDYKYNGGSDFISTFLINTLNYNCMNNSSPICIYNGKIYNGPYNKYYFEYNIETNSSITKFNCDKDVYGMTAFNNNLYMISDISNNIEIHKYDGTTLTKVTDLSIRGAYNHHTNFACTYKDKLFLFDDAPATNYTTYSATEKKFNNGTLIIQKSKDDNYGLYKVALNDKYGIINHFGFDDAFFYGNGGFEWDTEMYYGDGTKWIRFK